MNVDFPSSARGQLYNGTVVFDLFRGVDTYASARAGQAVTGKCGDATVNLTVDSVQIGPLGQFFTPHGNAHVANVGRTFDVRTLADAVEAKSSTGPKDTKALDPRELYTAVHFRVVSVVDPQIAVPVMGGEYVVPSAARA